MKRYLFILGLIYLIIVSVFLIGKYDFIADSSLYTIRAFGWTDYIGAGQKGPVEWLGYSTWWSSLSFQDSPPVVYAIEYIFLRLFGGVTASAQIPFFIAEIIIYCSIYFCVKKISDEETALWSSTAFAVSSLALWSTLSGNLEGIQSLFIVLHFLSTALYIKFKSEKYLYLSAVFMGLSLMSKYNSNFYCS